MAREEFNLLDVPKYIQNFNVESLIQESKKDLSYSKIAFYTGKCKMRYFFQRVLRIKIPDEFYFYVGERTHDHCCRFWEQDYKSYDSFIKQFPIFFIGRQKDPSSSGRNPGYFKSKNEFWFWLRRAQEYVGNYFHIRKGERQIEIPALHETPISGLYKGYKFSAILDEVSLLKDERKIVDIKTIRNPPPDKIAANFSTSEQYPLYCILLPQWLDSDGPEKMIEREREKVEELKTEKSRIKALDIITKKEKNVKILRENDSPFSFELIFPRNSFRTKIEITDEVKGTLDETLDSFIKGIDNMDFYRKKLTGRWNCHNDCMYYPVCVSYDDKKSPIEELLRMYEKKLITVLPRKTAPIPGRSLTFTLTNFLPLFLGQDPIVQGNEPKKLKKGKEKNENEIPEGQEQLEMIFA
jgi:hypothetical protein